MISTVNSACQQGGDLARHFRRDFDLELQRIAEGLGREAELAVPVDGKRARFARPLVALDTLAERGGNLVKAATRLALVSSDRALLAAQAAASRSYSGSSLRRTSAAICCASLDSDTLMLVLGASPSR